MNLPRLVRSAQTSIAGAREYWRGWPVENTVLPQVFFCFFFLHSLRLEANFGNLLAPFSSLSSFWIVSASHACSLSALLTPGRPQKGLRFGKNLQWKFENWKFRQKCHFASRSFFIVFRHFALKSSVSVTGIQFCFVYYMEDKPSEDQTWVCQVFTARMRRHGIQN